MQSLAQKQSPTRQQPKSALAKPDASAAGNDLHAIQNLQRSAGNQAVLRLLQSPAADSSDHPNSPGTGTPLSPPLSPIAAPPLRPTPRLTFQTKLTVNTPGDAYEQEADRVAEQVMRMPEPQSQRTCACGGTCDDCMKNHDSSPLQMKSPGGLPQGQTEAPPSVDRVLDSPGQPLDSGTRALMEPRFGRDFSPVRIHSGAEAQRSAREVNARAFTVGNHVVFAEAQLSPATREGRGLLAHELTHVVQQTSLGTTASFNSLQKAPGDGPSPSKPARYFDVSRGGLTAAERQKLLDLRKKYKLPVQATEDDETIVAVLVFENGEELEFHSGDFGGYHAGVGPRDIRGGKGSGASRFNRSHVELWASQAMRDRGVKRGVLLIEKEPCAVCGGYGKGRPEVDTRTPSVSNALADDTQLLVVDEAQAIYLRSTHSGPATSPPKASPSRSGKSSDPTAKQLAQTDASIAQSAKGQTDVQQLAKPEPSKPQLTKPEPTQSKPTKTEPVKAGPVKLDPVKTEPVKTAPVKTEPAKVSQKPAALDPSSVVSTTPKPSATEQPSAAKPSLPQADVETPAGPSRKPPAEINLSDYPPDREGPVVGRFRDGAAIGATIAAVQGAVTIVSLATDTDISALGFVQWHFNSEIDDAYAEFQSAYPEVSALRNQTGLDQAAKAYDAALENLQTPKKLLTAIALLSLGVPEDQRAAFIQTQSENIAKMGGGQERLQAYVDAGADYLRIASEVEEALQNLQYYDLPAMADDVGRRASALADASSQLMDTFYWMLQFPTAYFGPGEWAALETMHVAGVLGALSGRISGLSSEISSRANGYQQLWDELEKNQVKVYEHEKMLAEAYHLKVPF